MGLYFQETKLTPFRELRQVVVTKGGNEGTRGWRLLSRSRTIR